MELQGKIIQIGQTETVGSKGFTKRQLVIESLEQYPQQIPIDFVKDKTSFLDGKKIGEQVKVSINIRGNEYNGKYFVNIQGWRIEKTGGSSHNPKGDYSEENNPHRSEQDDDYSDLPF